jgi:probable rRNA maturation factor
MTRPTKSGAEKGAAASRRPARRPRPALTLSLQLADARHRGVLSRQRVGRWLRAALERPATITVRVVDGDEGLALNRAWRHQEHATNVLTFPYATEPEIEADLVLCAPVIEREADAQGVTLEAHYAHLLVHGALHAQGFDHVTDADAARMESRETEILAGLGFADPYRRG